MANSKIKAPMIIVVGVSNINNVGANSGGVTSVPISVPNGYTPVLAVAEEYSAQNMLECHVESYNNTSVTVRYANLRGSATNLKLRVRAICQ